MGVNSLPKTVTRQRRDCDLNPGPSATESSTLTTRLPSHPLVELFTIKRSYGCQQSRYLTGPCGVLVQGLVDNSTQNRPGEKST